MRDSEEREFKDLVQYGLKAVLDLLIPRQCLVCGKTLGSSETHLCSECLEDLPLTYYWLRKFNPMADRFNELIQNDLEEKWKEGYLPARTDYAFATALFFFRDESEYRHITHQLKYHGNIPAGIFFGTLLGKKLASADHFLDVDMVIPVPLYWSRKWKRGYNQAEIVARMVASELGAEMNTAILRRCRRTQTQTRLGIEDKKKNVQGAFEVGQDIKKAGTQDHQSPRHLLLIDDVFTTGSTLIACFTALRTVFPPSVRISVATLGFVGGG